MEQPTVLLVQEEEATRNTLAQLLVQEGFAVLTAASGHDALGVFRASLTPIDVLVLDVPLRDLDGVDLCACLRRQHPDRPVIVCTGDVEPGEKAQFARLGVQGFFRKPVDLESLLTTVRRALRSPPA